MNQYLLPALALFLTIYDVLSTIIAFSLGATEQNSFVVAQPFLLVVLIKLALFVMLLWFTKIHKPNPKFLQKFPFKERGHKAFCSGCWLVIIVWYVWIALIGNTLVILKLLNWL